ncbi:uncharacterized protein LOC129962669 isoform X2 [Argiope bruennichi]|uniref:UDP-galactose/UDP-glucose transporter 7 like protein n=2 Tax=Argiope bruennichi TaxID=94029 RepID=A0A8T0F0S2_ARGBR|nr:uncharacterized protein LOC129962669 isoform X2 [Argiope bruennichi]KAF8783464.1 UDP-galactose/UDP-glucose transporter 7 like protein [Argiope bruennichi]
MKQSIGNYVSHEGKEHGSKSNKEIMQSISSALLYGICSTSMAFINKLVMTSYKFDFPFLIMTCQMMFCIIFIEFLRMNSAFYIPRYSLKLGKSFLWPSMFYALHSITALHALSGMSIPIYVAIKRCAPIVTLLLSIVLLKKELPSKKIILAVILISSGCILAGLGDIELDIRAYSYGALSVVAQGIYLTLAQKSLEEMSALLVLYVTGYNTVPLFIFASLFYETQEVLQSESFSDLGFIAYFTIQVVIGVLLNYSLFLCTASNSALTTSLVGVLKSILQTTIGFFTFGGIKFNVINIFGIVINMFGGIMYACAKYTEKYTTIVQSNVKPI